MDAEDVTDIFWAFVGDVIIEPEYRTLPPYLQMEKIVQSQQRMKIDFRIFDVKPALLFQFESEYTGNYDAPYLIFNTIHDMMFMLRDFFVFIEDGRGQTLTILIQTITEWIEMDTINRMLQSSSIS